MAFPETVDEVTGRIPAVDTQEVPAVDDLPAPIHRSRRRWLVAGAVVVLAAGAGIGIWLGTSGSSGPALAVSTRTVAVTTGTMKQTVSTSGTISPADQASLDFAVSGKVTAVDVSTGQAVSAG
ncbi:MAG TPA: hypothetical protein VHW47_02740, partial [Acidimicrobiales bacterium]|nr:hypothetical protein [Acidimicrobiales bacterium]